MKRNSCTLLTLVKNGMDGWIDGVGSSLMATSKLLSYLGEGVGVGHTFLSFFPVSSWFLLCFFLLFLYCLFIIIM